MQWKLREEVKRRHSNTCPSFPLHLEGNTTLHTPYNSLKTAQLKALSEGPFIKTWVFHGNRDFKDRVRCNDALWQSQNQQRRIRQWLLSQSRPVTSEHGQFPLVLMTAMTAMTAMTTMTTMTATTGTTATIAEQQCFTHLAHGEVESFITNHNTLPRT